MLPHSYLTLKRTIKVLLVCSKHDMRLSDVNILETLVNDIEITNKNILTNYKYNSINYYINYIACILFYIMCIQVTRCPI